MIKCVLSQQFDELIFWRIGGLYESLHLWDGLELFEADLHLPELLYNGLD